MVRAFKSRRVSSPQAPRIEDEVAPTLQASRASLAKPSSVTPLEREEEEDEPTRTPPPPPLRTSVEPPASREHPLTRLFISFYQRGRPLCVCKAYFYLQNTQSHPSSNGSDSHPPTSTSSATVETLIGYSLPPDCSLFLYSFSNDLRSSLSIF